MIASRRGTAALALLGALILCAAAAQSATAVPGWESSKNTTAFTCVEGGGKLDFSDPHCDHGVAEGSGEYGHVEIPRNTTTEIETEGGKSTLISHPAGIEVKITSETVHGEGWIENSQVETEGGVIDHRVKGHLSIGLSSLSLDGLAGCRVAEPIVATFDFESVEKENAMGIEFREAGAAPFTEFTIEGCILAGTYPLRGSMVATGTGESPSSGATIKFNPDSTHESLEFFGNKNTTFESETTVKMKNGNPISLTTVT